jgi:hypothetical protein
MSIQSKKIKTHDDFCNSSSSNSCCDGACKVCKAAFEAGRNSNRNQKKNNIQQLRAEIAALMVPAFVALRNGNLVEASECIDKLLQLSAV